MIKRMKNHRNTRINILTVVSFISLVFVITPIYCVAGPNPIKITDGIYDCYSPKFSPDGEKILYVSNESDDGYWQVWVMNTDGSNRVQLTTEPVNHSSPSFSPDGEKIAYAKESDDGATRIWVMNADGMNQTQVSDQFGGYPIFHSDGKRILYSQSGRIWLMNIDGTNQTKIEFVGFMPPSIIKSPTINPDEKKITFFVKPLLVVSSYTPSYFVGIVAVDGSHYTNLTAIGPGEDGKYPSFTPDGKSILYTSFGDLWLMDIDGSNKTLFLDKQGQISYPSFSPNGKKIVYVEDGDIWIYTLDVEDGVSNDYMVRWIYIMVTVIVVVIAAGAAYRLWRKKRIGIS